MTPAPFFSVRANVATKLQNTWLVQRNHHLLTKILKSATQTIWETTKCETNYQKRPPIPHRELAIRPNPLHKDKSKQTWQEQSHNNHHKKTKRNATSMNIQTSKNRNISNQNKYPANSKWKKNNMIIYDFYLLTFNHFTLFY